MQSNFARELVRFFFYPIACFLGLSLFTGTLWATPQVREMREDAELTDVCFIDAERGWAVGDRGVTWHTQDGGRSWRQQTSGVSCRLESVHFVDPDHGCAVGGFIHPYTQRTTGIVVRTTDGGRRWSRVPGSTMPALKKIKLITRNEGWAAGQPSAMYPTAVFRTTDGGRSWSIVPEGFGQRWLCGDFRDTKTGVVGGREGAISVVNEKDVKPARMPDLGLRSVCDLKLWGRTEGWLAGDGGLLMHTIDGGISWQLPPAQPPATTLEQFDFSAVAVQGEHCWVAGAPGSVIFHSPDAGRTWHAQSTGQQLPINRLAFIDTRHGWAVGAMGTILATRDGGETWHRQRCGGTRAALLCVLGTVDAVPIEILTKIGADEGYLSVVELAGHRDWESENPFAAHAADRTAMLVSESGGSAANLAWRFPLRQTGLKLSAKQIIDTWDRAGDGMGARRYEEQLVRKIRQWRPDVILTHDIHEADHDALAIVINQAVLKAVEAAGDSTAYPDQLTAGKLEPWKIKKVYTTLPGEKVGTVNLTSAHLAARLGQSIADFTAPLAGILSTEISPRPATFGCQLVVDRLAQGVAQRDLFSGVVVHPGSDARRRLHDAAVGDLEDLRRLAQKRRNLERLLTNASGGIVREEAWLGEINELTRDLGPDAAGELLFDLAARYRRGGQAELSAQALEVLIERHNTHPLSDAAYAMLLNHYASAEKAQFRQPVSPHKENLAGEAGSADDEVTGFAASPEPMNDQRDASRGIAIAKEIERLRPQLYADPIVRLPAASMYRRLGDDRAARSLWPALAALPPNFSFAMCAQTEVWLTTTTNVPPKPLGTVTLAPQRPFLDGKLDDRIWANAKPLELSSAQGDDLQWPAVVLMAHDEQFLYVAANCRIPSGSKYAGAPSTRPRDAEMSQQDRLELLLDTDRDWTTYFRLAVDHRGCTWEACAGDSSWNPNWYVATARSGETWSMEAAIPMAALSAQPPRSRECWAAGVQRIVPGVGLQSWTRPASVAGTPSGFGLLMFE